MSSGRRVPGYVNYVVTSLFVEDVIDSIERIIEAKSTGSFTLSPATVSRKPTLAAGRTEFDLDAGSSTTSVWMAPTEIYRCEVIDSRT